MKGQLWEECSCGVEPVCADCFRCETHCKCGEHHKKTIQEFIPAVEPYRRGIGQGFGPGEDGEA